MQYENILNNALLRVDDKYSKRQDSPIFNGIAPACYEISKVYELIEQHLKQSFGVTANGIYLDNLAKEVGLDRFKATYSVKKAEFKDNEKQPFNVEIGTRFAKEEFSFEVIQKIDEGIYLLRCEQSGSITNEITGDIMPIDSISVASAKIVQNIIPAVDDETDEQLRERYLQKVRQPATSGNIYHYRLWTMEVSGVGAVKIFPLWNGNGTVKVMIVTNEIKTADSSLIEKVKNHIDTVRPIGATVTVITPTTKDITVNAKVTMSLNSNIELTKQDFKMKIEKYIKEVVKEYFKDIKANSYFISLAQVGKHLLESKNVVDYRELKLNNTVSNIEFTSEQIPNITDINLEVVV